VRNELLRHSVHLEDFGGEVLGIEISGLKVSGV
jgi:hypothetical protein